jgi:hypothetical protein
MPATNLLLILLVALVCSCSSLDSSPVSPHDRSLQQVNHAQPLPASPQVARQLLPPPAAPRRKLLGLLGVAVDGAMRLSEAAPNLFAEPQSVDSTYSVPAGCANAAGAAGVVADTSTCE